MASVKAARSGGSWIEFRSGAANARARLFCFHGAGGGAVAFRGWSRVLGPSIEVCPIQLPGRLTRLAETPFSKMAPLVSALTDAVVKELDLPFAFFGHSMGTLVAFELARELRRRGLSTPRLLVVAGRGAPQIAVVREPLHKLPDAAMLAAVQERYRSIPDEIMREPDLVDLIARPLRADLEVHETYSYSHEPPLDAPILAFGGDDDRLVPVERLEAWREQTTSRFAFHVLRGGHYFHTEMENEITVLRLLETELAEYSRPANRG